MQKQQTSNYLHFPHEKLYQKPYRIYGRESDVIQRIPDHFTFKNNLINWYSQYIEPTMIAPYLSLCIGLIIQVKK